MTKSKTNLSARQRFASNMKIARQKIGISQELLAEKCGLHRTYIGAVERGERNISVDNMERIAQAIGVDIIKLLASD